ncbi:hypothetical protein ColLi_00276 [Colletotrichum liriopes]|uniref:Secreted protein n=1 Tax=Colletotrichum liriopes TaxID=708192 RepID=A0AA37GBN7_9PEZI|nr:hypothetical protein ColLi_00276 [Colletotrichum liriopes]
MFSLNTVVALMFINSANSNITIVIAAPADNIKRLDDIKNCYCGRDTGSALVSDPGTTKAACPDYGTVGEHAAE